MTPAIELKGLGKVYDGTVALAQVNQAFDRGRVHSLMGKNGSGKSTLVRILAGAVRQTVGEVYINGRRTVIDSPRDAFAAGIMTVHQELSLVPSLSVGENIYLGRLPRKRVLGIRVVDWDAVQRDAAAILHEMAIDIDPRRPVSSLSVGEQQIVEIVKAMSFQPEILLLDEPTSALATREVEQLFELIRRLRARGMTMIYITHRMNELFAIADSCTVLRDGRVVGTVAMADASSDMIVGMMFGGIGRAHRPDKAEPVRAKPVLEVRHLSRRGAFANISFGLHAGEVLGIAGLMGAGRTELLRSIFGADPFGSGEVLLDGRPVRRLTPKAMKRLGLGYTPENRKEVGLVQMLSSHDNLCLASLPRITRHGVTSRRRETPFVRRQVRDLDIKVSDPMLPVSSLSGGNQQKIVVGNWLNTLPSVMLFDEPTRGIDVQAKQQIFEIIWRKAGEGLAVVFVSSELEELLDVADRILVLRHGRIVGEVEPKDTSLAELYRLCMEGRPNES
jgi:ABC-type sugar transport system ATPase subunit